MAARQRRPFLMTDEHRLKIANSNILKCLIDHVKGDREMSQTQVTAGIALLKKVMPDISSIELSSAPDNPVQVVNSIVLVGKVASSDTDS